MSEMAFQQANGIEFGKNMSEMTFQRANGSESRKNMSEFAFQQANGSENQEFNPDRPPVAKNRPSRTAGATAPRGVPDSGTRMEP